MVKFGLSQLKAKAQIFILLYLLNKFMAKKILLIEDNIDSTKIYSNRLLKEGYDVVLAKNGKEGLKKAMEELPDIILLDLLMPVFDGKKFLEQLRKRKELLYVPVIILSNISDPEITVNAERDTLSNEQKAKRYLEVEDYLIKTNASLDQIINSIEKILS